VASASEIPPVGIVFIAVASVVVFYGIVHTTGNFFGLWEAWYPKWYAAAALLFMIPMSGMVFGVFWFEAFGDILFKSPEARDRVRDLYESTLVVLWAVVTVRAVFLLFQYFWPTSNLIMGGIAALLFFAAYLAADYFFELPAFDFIGVSEGAR
jgi:hypothetical protein